MDYFEMQEKAKRKSSLLVFLFFVAIFGLVIMSYLIVQLPLLFASPESDGTGFQGEWNPALFIGIAFSVVSLVFTTSAIKLFLLKKGGMTVAESLGGIKVDPSNPDPKYKQLLNVVEEMAIASGLPVPAIYVLEEENGINAFAAGFNPSDAVVGVTKGALEAFDRDELQAVVAHEFSHILNGDMRLNIRLMGYLSGIFVLTVVGRTLFRAGSMSGRGRNNNLAVLSLLGFAFLNSGFLGLLLGRLIKAAVSRQREFLADASSVQFTRNPVGIYRALKKIQEHSEGSLIQSPQAEVASHMFFSAGINTFFERLFSTHPPLQVRMDSIQKLAPALIAGAGHSRDYSDLKPTGEQMKTLRSSSEGLGAQVPSPSEKKKQIFQGTVMAGSVMRSGILETAGGLDEDHIRYAREILSEIPETVKSLAHESFGARAVVYCLLLDRLDPSVRERQVQALSDLVDPMVYREFNNVLSSMLQVPTKARIPLLDMAIPALSNLTYNQYEEFVNHITALIQADEKMDLFEWCLLRILNHHLGDRYASKPSVSETEELRGLGMESAADHVLSLLAYQTAMPESAESAYLDASRMIGLKTSSMNRKLKWSEVDSALDNLAQLLPMEKKKFLQACERIVLYDGSMQEREFEVFRAIADSLNCPIPPRIFSL